MPSVFFLFWQIATVACTYKVWKNLRLQTMYMWNCIFFLDVLLQINNKILLIWAWYGQFYRLKERVMSPDKSVILSFNYWSGILTLLTEKWENWLIFKLISAWHKKKMYISNFHWLFSHLACFKHFEEIVGNRLFSSLVRQSNSSLLINFNKFY